METPIEQVARSMKVRDLHPALDEVVRAAELDRDKFRLAFPATPEGKLDLGDHHRIHLYDGAKAAVWEVPSIRALFRGDQIPPKFEAEPPPAYMPLFDAIEINAVLFCDAAGDKTDGEFEEAYSNLRRRPDGKPFSDLQACLWQAAAVLAGMRPVSAAEYEAIIGRLVRSASTFRIGLVSRNYISTLRLTRSMARD
jgi:hypothetical protein